jgi:DNA-binding response OmpR family regulator
MSAAAVMRGTGRVLVIDDTELNCMLVQSVLEVHGYEVSQAMRGSEDLLKSIFTSPPDIIILDVMMPGINGLVMCQRLRDDERTMHIPILMVTSLSDRSVRQRAFAAGASDIIIKPIDTQELSQRVRNAMVTKSAFDASRSALAAMKVEEAKLRNWWTAFIHGLRGPMAAIHQEIQLAKSRLPQDERSAHQWQRLAELSDFINDQLISSVQANNVACGQHALVLERCLITGLLKTAMALTQLKYPDVSITLSAPEHYLTCDRTLMQRALDSLLKHMAQSSLRALSIHVRYDAGSTEIALRSDGPSASDPRGASGFYPTTAADASGPQPFSDMNLSFCAFVVEAHGGKMRAESNVGANQLWISLPDITPTWTAP